MFEAEFHRQDISGSKIDLKFPSGSRVTIVGPSSTGKTAFCLLACGQPLLKGFSGKAILNDIDLGHLTTEKRAAMVAYVPSDPTLLYSGMKSSVIDEVLFSKQMLGLNASRQDADVRALIDVFQLGSLLDRDPFTLSGGEATRVAIAIALVKQPLLVVLDQAYECLDPESVQQVRHAIDLYLADGTIIIEMVSRRPEWINILDQSGDKFCDWTCYVEDRSMRRHSADDNPKTSVGFHKKYVPTGQKILDVEALRYCYPRSTFCLGPIDFDTLAGERVAILGSNGSGKTTLLRSLALLLEAEYEKLSVRVQGETCFPKKKHEWASRCLYVFQNPDDQIFLPSVKEELESSAKNFGRLDTKRFELVSDHFGFTADFGKSPFSLSRPKRRLMTIASAIIARSPVTLLDEPSIFLDDLQLGVLEEALTLFFDENQCLLMISHNLGFVEKVCTTHLCLDKGLRI